MKAAFLLALLVIGGALLWWVAGNFAWRAPTGWYIRKDGELYSRTRYATREACDAARPPKTFCARERIYDARRQMLHPHR